MGKKLIIDTDGGIDDAIALLASFSEPELEILGITTVYSNTSVENATRNALDLMLMKKRDDIPVAKGADRPLSGVEKKSSSDVHGENGLGNIVIPHSSRKELDIGASNFIVNKVNEYPGEVTILTLGPMTNIAKALEIDPTIAKKTKRLVVMGGAVFTHGNVTACSEANIHADSTAAKIVFSSGFDLYLIGLDVTTKAEFSKAKLDALSSFQDDASKPIYDFVKSMLRFYFDFYFRVEGTFLSSPVHDPLALMAVLDDSLFAFRRLPVSVIVSDDITNGMTIADMRCHPTEQNYVNVAIDVDANRAVWKILSYFVSPQYLKEV